MEGQSYCVCPDFWIQQVFEVWFNEEEDAVLRTLEHERSSKEDQKNSVWHETKTGTGMRGEQDRAAEGDEDSDPSRENKDY